jgi:hypothetical protein
MYYLVWLLCIPPLLYLAFHMSLTFQLGISQCTLYNTQKGNSGERLRVLYSLKYLSYVVLYSSYRTPWKNNK